MPPVAESDLEPLTYTYYDDYTWSGKQSFNSSYLTRLSAGSNPYGETNTTYSTKTRGRITGTKVKVLGSSPEKWLTTTTYYDDKGRVLQTIAGQYQRRHGCGH